MPETSRPHPSSLHFSLLLDLLRWLPICVLVGGLAGSASALLLVSLNFATQVRENHVWIIWLLAPAGFLVGLMYHRFGRSVEAGNNLVLEEIHSPKSTVPLRMTPLIILGTFLTHLFGGSAGREGTAVQTGASLADQLSRPLRLSPEDRRILLMTGVSAGFGSVFGTPLAGAVFGIEVLSFGELNYRGLAPCLLASFAGDLVTRAWHVQHTVYQVTEVPALGASSIVSSIASGIVFGLVAMAFAKTTHLISRTLKKRVSYGPLRPTIGGVLVTLAVFSFHATKYVGLGVPTIVASFQHKLPVYDWAAKFIFTVVTLGSGFKGGEVTPLFFIGSTLGNALSRVLPLPSTLLAGMGFAAVFAGAANTPLAATLMAIELFGAEAGAFAGIACVVSYLCSGHGGIYQSQRVGISKHPLWMFHQGKPLDALESSSETKRIETPQAAKEDSER